MQTPNQRKRHLIKDHDFDENFFFAVIRFGIGDQIRAWGSGNERAQTPSKTSNVGRTHESMKQDFDHSFEITDSQGQSNPGSRRRTPKTSTQSSRASSSQPFDSGMEDLSRSMQTVSLVPNSVQFGREATRVTHAPYKRNVSFPDIKMHSSHYSKRSMSEDDEDGDDEGRDESLEGDEPQLGVRFAEEVAIRFLSPVDRRYKYARKKNTGRGNGRTGGVHSDDETGARSKNSRHYRPNNGYRGRARGGRGKAGTERGF